MTFLNPFVLIALAAAGIPLLLHLFNLRKLKVIDFSSLKFLKELQKTSIKKLKLKRWLLLALRIGVVVFAVLAFARPALRSAFSLPGAHSKSSIVILIDNSGSMGVKNELGQRLKRAKEYAIDIINSLENSDELFVLPMCDLSSAQEMLPLQNRENMRSAVNLVKLTNAKANLDAALNTAALLLQKSKNINKEIFLLSDMQKANNRNDKLKIFSQDERLFVIMKSFSNSQIQNLGLDSIKFLSSVIEQNKPIVMRAWVHNYGTSTQTANISLTIQNGTNTPERIAKQSYEVADNTTQAIDISGVPKYGGMIFGTLELETDPFIADNTRYFALNIPDKINAAFVGSNQDTKYLQLIMSIDSKRLSGSFFSENGFSGVDLNKYNPIVLANPILNNSDIDRLKKFVENGGGVVIYAGENFVKNNSVLPKFGITSGFQVSNAANGTSDSLKNNKMYFGSVAKEHPIFSGVFDEINSSRLESPDLKKYISSQNGTPIIKLSQGGNFISEHNIGKGKIIFIANPANLEWSNFAAMNLFAPVAIRSILYASATKDNYPSVTTNQTLTIPLPNKFSHLDKVKIIYPDRNDEVVPVRKYPSGNFIGFNHTTNSGNYKIISTEPTTSGIISAFSVNPDNQESNLLSMNQTEAEEYLSDKFVNKQNLKFITINSDNYLQEIKSQRIGLELWRYMLALALLCAFVEMWVARN